MSSKVRPGWRPRQRQATVLGQKQTLWLAPRCSCLSDIPGFGSLTTVEHAYQVNVLLKTRPISCHTTKLTRVVSAARSYMPASNKRRQRCGTMCLKTQALTPRYTVCAPYMLRHSRRRFETVTYYCERIKWDSRSACILPAEEEVVHRHAHLEHP